MDDVGTDSFTYPALVNFQSPMECSPHGDQMNGLERTLFVFKTVE
jgi:hypothetical protein